MPDLGAPISYLVLASGTPVYGSDGGQIGVVEHVLAVPEEDVFDGIVVKIHDGVFKDEMRFVDAPEVAEIHEHGVALSITTADAATLPEPSENPAVLEASPDETVPSALSAKLRRAWDLISGNY
jgi:hypothetical protein